MMEKLKTDLNLIAAIKRAKDHVMTPDEIRAQRRSFVAGQIDWPDKTRDEVRAIVNEYLDRMGM